MKIPMTVDLSKDPFGSKKKFLQSVIDNHAYSKSEDQMTIYCMDDAGNLFKVFKVTPKSSLWHIA